MTDASAEPLVEIEALSVTYDTPDGPVAALREIDLRVASGQVLGLVGESGSGKSTLAQALMALPPGRARRSGRLSFEGVDLLRLDEGRLRDLRGDRIASIFQDPFTALNPVMRIGRQLELFQHRQRGRSRRQKRMLARDALARVGIADPARQLDRYPFELSGGMRQRVAIAAALLATPSLLVADEPTTALDATTAGQIVALLRDSRAMVQGAIVIVTHDLQVVRALCDRVAVLYAGELVEEGTARQVLQAPRHPYTRALLDCALELPTRAGTAPRGRFATIPGQPPDRSAIRAGCAFAARCAVALPVCTVEPPHLARTSNGVARCFRLPVDAGSAHDSAA